MRWRSSIHPLLLLLFSFFILLAGKTSTSEFKICAYNVDKFNLEKSLNSRVLHTLTRILSHCDISLLQDVVDSDGKAIKALLSSLNRYNGHTYQTVSSKSLGKSPDDMQKYVFLYRNKIVTVTNQYQYDKEHFTRAPFVVQFRSSKTALKEFILIPLHAEPSQAVHEIDRLYDVFSDVSKKWKNTNVMFLGDFHAGCAYMTRTDKKNIRLFKDSHFFWLIGDKVDTTVTDVTTCAYDRIVVHGEPFLKAIVPYSAKVFNFGKDLKITQSKVLEVSKNLPVEVKMKSSALLLQATPLLILLSVSVILHSFLSPL